MKTPEEYAEIAEELLNQGNRYNYEETKGAVARAQVYATLSQAAAMSDQIKWWQLRDEQMGLGTSEERGLSIG